MALVCKAHMEGVSARRIADLDRVIVSFDIKTTEDAGTRMVFLRPLVTWGLNGVELVDSDEHGEIKVAITRRRLTPLGSDVGPNPWPTSQPCGRLTDR